MSKTWGGDPGGDKTGVGTDAQSAGGDAFIISEPDAKDPEYSKKKEAYDEFKEMADKELLAVKLADFVGQNCIAINLMWTLVAGFLVMFMQAGFALVETGLCRAKNASHTMLMNFLVLDSRIRLDVWCHAGSKPRWNGRPGRRQRSGD
jgi:ammonium transporter, Amt family